LNIRSKARSPSAALLQSDLKDGTAPRAPRALSRKNESVNPSVALSNPLLQSEQKDGTDSAGTTCFIAENESVNPSVALSNPLLQSDQKDGTDSAGTARRVRNHPRLCRKTINQN